MTDDFTSDWRPNGRPQSTIALNFSAALDDLFKLDGGSLDNLSQTVHQKKHRVSSQNQELEALEARLRETEERLKLVSTTPSPRAASRTASRRQVPTKATSSEVESPAETGRTVPTDSRPNGARPGPTSRAASDVTRSLPGAVPETPNSVAGNDYVVVGKTSIQDNDEQASRRLDKKDSGD